MIFNISKCYHIFQSSIFGKVTVGHSEFDVLCNENRELRGLSTLDIELHSIPG